MEARVVVLAGPSGSGKSRLAARLGVPVLRLDDFYKDGTDPTLPRSDLGIVDWDDPLSWDLDAACAAIERLCRTGVVEAPVYELAANAATGSRTVRTDGHAIVVAEGLFAPLVVGRSRERGLLADALCVRHHRLVTFVLRLARDLREHRKPPLVLLRRGWRLLRDEPRVVAEAVAHGCRPVSPRRAERELGCGGQSRRDGERGIRARSGKAEARRRSWLRRVVRTPPVGMRGRARRRPD